MIAVWFFHLPFYWLAYFDLLLQRSTQNYTVIERSETEPNGSFFSSPLNTKAIQRYCHQLYYLSLGSSFLAMSRSWIASDEAFSRRQIGHPVEMEKRRDNSLGNKPAIIFFWWWWLWLHFGPVGESEQTWTSTTVFFFTEPRPYVTWHNAAVSATSDVCTADIGQSV